MLIIASLAFLFLFQPMAQKHTTTSSASQNTSSTSFLTVTIPANLTSIPNLSATTTIAMHVNFTQEIQTFNNSLAANKLVLEQLVSPSMVLPGLPAQPKIFPICSGGSCYYQTGLQSFAAGQLYYYIQAGYATNFTVDYPRNYTTKYDTDTAPTAMQFFVAYVHANATTSLYNSIISGWLSFNPNGTAISPSATMGNSTRIFASQYLHGQQYMSIFHYDNFVVEDIAEGNIGYLSPSYLVNISQRQYGLLKGLN